MRTDRRTILKSLAAALAAVGVGRRGRADEPEPECVDWIEPDPESVNRCAPRFDDYCAWDFKDNPGRYITRATVADDVTFDVQVVMRREDPTP